ncbi:MAG: PAS domain S-box protein [Bacteroidia bacterium]
MSRDFITYAESPFFKSVSRSLILVEVMVFLFMLFQTQGEGTLFYLAVLQTSLHVLVYFLSRLYQLNLYEWLIPGLFTLMIYSNSLGGLKVTFAGYTISLVFYSFFLIKNKWLSFSYMISFILISGFSEYQKGVEFEVILMLVMPGLGFTTLFYTALRYLQKVQLELASRNKELEQSQLNLKTLIENTNALIWAIDSNYQFLNGNTAYAITFQQKTGQFLQVGMNVLEPIQGRHEYDFWKKLYDRVLAGEQVLCEDQTLDNYEKSIFWEYTLNPMKLPNGNVYGATIMAKDISKKKIFESRRRENEALLNGVLNNMPIGFQMFDELGNLVLMNQSMKEILGVKPDLSSNEKPVLNVFHDNLFVLNELDIIFKEVYLKGINRNLEIEIDFNVPENTWSTSRRKIFFELNIFPLFDEVHQVIAVVCLSNEITKRKHTEKLMLDQNKRLEEYAFTISHILRRPIANIISLSSLIKSEDVLKPEDVQLVEFLNESTHQLDQILKELNQNITIKPDYFNDYKNHSGR